jgi:hypothetical protein
VRLLLERTLRLDGQLGRHVCENFRSTLRETMSSWLRIRRVVKRERLMLFGCRRR